MQFISKVVKQLSSQIDVWLLHCPATAKAMHCCTILGNYWLIDSSKIISYLSIVAGKKFSNLKIGAKLAKCQVSQEPPLM